jgi:hypothetical protein
MKTLLNSEYIFQHENVKLTLYINYDNKSYDIQESNQEGVFYGKCYNVIEGIDKAQLLVEIMAFIDNEFDYYR